MCGRTSCTLEPDELAKSCQYVNDRGENRKPQWHTSDCSKFMPSPNISPQSFTPVLVSACKVISEENKELMSNDESMLKMMKWGLIPSWHRGDPSSFGYKMNNARIESIMEKKSFKGPLEKGRRCVVLAEGFYEWQVVKGSREKQPYFVYFKRDIKPCDNNNKPFEDDKSSKPLLTMAGIFDVWHSSEEGEPLYSYSVITLEAKAPFRNIHHRVPALLKDEDSVHQWLHSEEVDYKQALKLLSADDYLDWHPVSKAVNNSRYKELDCTKAIDLTLVDKMKNRSKITNWFEASPKKRESTSGTNAEPAVKREKLEQ
ncbi:abasic site processing protein HMCES-like [Xenia sp. Carnegie-2017]|uniref:abasic site processing protein HMCES-like n=1 Tax=Xenia sp. Carnegie-2017 TaxID=2897299 RepID=UPI001F03F54D|nr:abasic site processing protein HMCES-like [Xenia sp. Carnegie-2017]